MLLKWGQRARRHFVTIMEIRMHLNRVNPGHNNTNSILVSGQRRITATYFTVTKRYESINPYGPTFPENWSGTLLLITKVMNDNAGYLCVVSSVISLGCLGDDNGHLST